MNLKNILGIGCTVITEGLLLYWNSKLSSRVKYLEGYNEDLKRENARKDWLLLKVSKKAAYDWVKKKEG